MSAQDIKETISTSEEFKIGSTMSTLSVDDWCDIEPINTNQLLPVPHLPMEIVPEALRDWLGDISYRMQVPIDFSAVTVLTMIGALIGTKCGVRPKQKDNWTVIPNLYGGIVSRPGILKKSPTISEVLKPLSIIEKKATKEFEEKIIDYEAEEIFQKAEKESINQSLKSAHKKNNLEEIENLKIRLKTLKSLKAPTLKRFRTNDATIEKLSELLNENPKGLIVVRDEIVGLIESWNKSGKECDRAFYLEGWNGYGDLFSDRIGRGTLYTENVCLSIFGGIQPLKLQRYLSKNGLTSDGMFQRFQMTVYPDEPKNFNLVDQYPDKEAKERAYKIIELLSQTSDFTKLGAKEDDFSKVPYFNFSNEAQLLFNEWYTELQNNNLRMDDEPLLTEHLSKYASLMPSLALIFHIIEVLDSKKDKTISLGSAEKAAAWCDFLREHAKRIYGMAGDLGEKAALTLSKKISKGKIADKFTVRDIYRRRWSNLTDKDIAQEACDILVDKGWLREKITLPAFQRKQKTEYFINPKARG